MKIHLSAVPVLSFFLLFFQLIDLSSVSAQSFSQNYVRTRIPRIAIPDEITLNSQSTNKDKVNTTIQYFDGLGRPLQTVNVKGSASGLSDLVQPVAYDALGREPLKYLPYTSPLNDGSYKADALQPNAGVRAFYTAPPSRVKGTPYPFAESRLEPSPLNRVLEQGAPGDAWQLSTSTSPNKGHTVNMDYASNDAAGLGLGSGFWARQYGVSMDATGIRTLTDQGNYGPNQLYVSISKGENWKSTDIKAGTTEEYKDKEGRVVLKRNFNVKNGATETLSTYYVYDDFGNLSYVLPPGATPDGPGLPSATTLANFCYQYRYDGRQRLVEKRLPGKGLESMVYNKLDQLVAHQDGNLLGKISWNYTKYDALGRVIATGWWKNGSVQISRVALQEIMDTQTVLWEVPAAIGLGYNNLAWPQGSIDFYVINYYDTYNVFGLPPGTYDYQPYLTNLKSDQTRGLLTVSMNRSVLNSTNRWNVFYYDRDGRVIQAQSNNHVGGMDVVHNQYDFTGQLTKTQRNHTGTPTVSLATLKTYTYDHQGRKIDTRLKIGASVNPSDSPLTEIVRINAGGPGVLFGTEAWTADQYFTGGTAFTNAAAIGNTTNDAVYQKERYGNFTYSIPVPQSGTYTVELNFAELYFQTAGSRVFNVNVENGQFSLQNLDLYRDYGYLNAAVIKAENIQVSDGLLTITFTSVVNLAKISGISVFRQLADAGILLAHNEYNELGQLVDKKLHSINGGQTYLQSMDYRYNSRGWLTSVNNAALSNDGGISNDDTNDQFGMSLAYETAPIPQYNGNIGQMNWKTGRVAGSSPMSYDFRYDPLNRLTEAVSSTAGLKNSNYGEYLSYDPMGNIERLGRYALISGVRQQIDSLQYTYEGNRHRRIDDLSASINKNLGFDDQDSQAVNEYTYDAIGRVKTDPNKKITGYTYSITGTLEKVVFATTPTASQLDYEYDRTGNKLKKTYTSGTSVTITDYVNGIQYTGPAATRTLNFIQTEEGRVMKNGSTYTYEYDLKDHLGNTRVTISPDPADASQTTPKVLQESSYYAFGMEMPGAELNYVSGTKNKYLYNTKELQDEPNFNLYDYGARFYDPAIGRWNEIDPLAEIARRYSLYVYGNDNPIRFTDPDGRMTSDEVMRMYNTQESNKSIQEMTAWSKRMGELGPSSIIDNEGGNTATSSTIDPPGKKSAISNTETANKGEEDGPGKGKKGGGDDTGTRPPDFYSLNITIAIPNQITATIVGWSGNITIDRYGQIFLSPIGVSVGKSAFSGSASLTANWIAQSKKPSATETYNFLSGHGISIGGGYIGGVNWSISPTNSGTKNAFGLGLYTPQVGASYNYTPGSFIFFKK
jgi:RHS repeat-associated protein